MYQPPIEPMLGQQFGKKEKGGEKKVKKKNFARAQSTRTERAPFGLLILPAPLLLIVLAEPESTLYHVTLT